MLQFSDLDQNLDQSVMFIFDFYILVNGYFILNFLKNVVLTHDIDIIIDGTTKIKGVNTRKRILRRYPNIFSVVSIFWAQWHKSSQ